MKYQSTIKLRNLTWDDVVATTHVNPFGDYLVEVYLESAPCVSAISEGYTHPSFAAFEASDDYDSAKQNTFRELELLIRKTLDALLLLAET